VADKSENYKLWYNIWLTKLATQLVEQTTAQNIPLTLEDAKKLLQNDTDHLTNWMASDIYQKYVARLDSKIPKNFTTADRVSTSAVKKRSAQIMSEDPSLSEEEATAQADKDIQKRQERDDKDVAKSKDPVAAKILTNIASILMDISEDVVALRESGSNALEQAEADREKGKGKEKEKSEDRKRSKFEGLLDFVSNVLNGLILMLFPFFLGIASKFVDLTKGFGLLIGSVLAAAMAFGVWLAKEKLFSMARERFFPRVPPSVPSTTPPTGPPSVPPSTGTPNVPGAPGAPGAPNAPGAPGAPNTRQVSSLTTLGKGIKDLGKGAGQAIKSILKGITDGFAYMGDNLTRVAKGALALGLIGVAFAPFALSLKLLKDVNAGAVLAATLGIGLVSASVIALGNAGNSIFKGVLALAALGGAMAIFGAALSTISGINGGELLKVGAALVGFALLAALLGPAIKFIALGSLAIALLGGALFVFGNALETISGIDEKSLLTTGKALIGVGLVAAGLGLMFPMIALGAAAMVILAGGLMVVGKALEVVAPSLESATESINKLNEIDGSNLLAVAKGIAGIGLAMVVFSASMLASSAMGVGSAILGLFVDSPLENLLEFAEDAKDVDVAGAADAVSKLTKAIKQLDSISGANLFNIGAGLTAVSAGLVAFSAANVTAGLGNLVTKFLSFLSGGKTPVEQIIELSEKHRQIFEAGKGVESMGKGVDSFAGVDTEKLSKTIEIISNLSDSQLEKLAKFQAVQSQPAATQQLGQAREGVNNAQGEKSAQSAPPVVNNVNNTAVNKSDTTYKSTRSGPAVKGDALQMGA
jgi:hypothetical protein